MEKQIHRTREEKLLSARNLLDLLHLLWKARLRSVVQVTVELVEDQHVQASHPVAFVEAQRPLLIDAPEALDIAPIDRCLERQSHGSLLLLLRGRPAR